MPPKMSALIRPTTTSDGVGVPQHVIPRIGRIDAQQINAHEVARADADGDGLRGQQRQGDVQRQQARHDQVVHRVRGQRAERVNLLGDAHGAQLGGDGRADPPGDHQAGQDRPQFAAHGNAHHRERGGVHFDFVELEVGLGAEHHAGERAGDEDHRLGLHADEIDLVEQVAPRHLEGEERGDGLFCQQGDAAQALQPFGNPFVAPKIHSRGQTSRRPAL